MGRKLGEATLFVLSSPSIRRGAASLCRPLFRLSWFLSLFLFFSSSPHSIELADETIISLGIPTQFSEDLELEILVMHLA